MNRSLLSSLLVYATVLVASLGWAYQTWTHEDELALSDKVVLLPGTPEQLASVVYRSKDLELTLEFREDERGRYAWGRAVPLGEAAEPPEPPVVPEGQPPPPPLPAPEPEEFKVGKVGDPAIEALAPFVAKRRLEGVALDDMAALGLAEPEATLEITRTGKEAKVYELGSNVFGGAAVYLRDPADGALYLVEARLLRPLLGGARSLGDRDLSGIDERKVERVVLHVDDREASFTQHNPDDADANYWSVTGDDTDNAEVAAWVRKALRLRSTRYVQPEQSMVDLAAAFAFDVYGEDSDAVRIEVLRNFDEEGQEQFFARSSYTRGLVRLPRSAVSEVSADLEAALRAGGA